MQYLIASVCILVPTAVALGFCFRMDAEYRIEHDDKEEL